MLYLAVDYSISIAWSMIQDRTVSVSELQAAISSISVSLHAGIIANIVNILLVT